jgi:hypothetical protein
MCTSAGRASWERGVGAAGACRQGGPCWLHPGSGCVGCGWMVQVQVTVVWADISQQQEGAPAPAAQCSCSCMQWGACLSKAQVPVWHGVVVSATVA